MKTITMLSIGGELVYVTAYTRTRFGKVEHVRSHFRSYPRS